MTPSALNIKGGSASPISISIDDSVGIKITRQKKLTLSVDSEIIMKTPKNVKINGVSQISALKSNTQSGFSLETDLHFLSDNIIRMEALVNPIQILMMSHKQEQCLNQSHQRKKKRI